MESKKEITGKPTVIKEVNIGLLKDALADLGQATRVELAKRTGISQPTVNVLMKEMVEKKIVLNLGVADSTGGRRAEVYTLNLKRKHIASIIIKQDSLEYCIFDLELHQEAEGKLSLKENITYTEFLTELLKKLLDATDDIKAITVGVPGAVSKEGNIFAIPQIPEWEQFDLKTYLEEKTGCDVVVVNDINAVAMGYLKAEKGKASQEDVKELVYLHVGEKGLGAGIMIDGKLHCGCNSFAGEVGYMQVAEDSIEGQLSREEKLQTESELSGEGGLSMKGCTGRAKLFAKVITNIICVLDPQKIVLGGRVTRELSEKIQDECRRHLPLKNLPEFTVIGDNTAYYFMGLGTMGQELLDHQLRLR